MNEGETFDANPVSYAFSFLTYSYIIQEPFPVCNHSKTRHFRAGFDDSQGDGMPKSILDFDDNLLVIGSTVLADSVGHHQCAALAALHKSRSCHFPVCSSLIPVTSGRSILRADRHLYHLLLFEIQRPISHALSIIRRSPDDVKTVFAHPAVPGRRAERTQAPS